MTVFLFDLIRTTRRGRPALIRCVYGLLLLLALWGLYESQPVVSPAGLAQLATTFSDIFLSAQFVAVAFLTPVYAAGAIVEERQRRTLDDLLMTDLSSGAIVFGKLAARGLHVFALVLTGLPVLSLMLSFGGIDPQRLLAGYVVATLTAISFAALSLFCSIRARTVMQAVASTFLAAALYCLTTFCVPVARGANPILALAHVIGIWDSKFTTVDLLAIFGVSQVMIVVALTVVATRRLRGQVEVGNEMVRPAELPPAETPIDTPAEECPLEPQPCDEDATVGVTRRAIPPIGGDPLLWKEEHFGRRIRVWKAVPLAAGLLLILMFDVGGLERGFRSLAFMMYTWWLIGTTLTAADGVGREREKHTLDGLLVLPGGRRAVIRAKWLGSLRRVRGRAYGLIILWVLVVIIGAMHPLVLPILMGTAASHLLFFAGLGVYLSVASRSTARAGLVAGLCLVLVNLLPPVAGSWVSPLAALVTLMQVEATHGMPEVDGALVVCGAYAVAGAIMCWQAFRRFHREADGERQS